VTTELQAFVSILVAFLGVTATVGVAMLARGQARESRIIADLRADVVVLKAERDEAEARERLLADYVHRLRDHIATGKGTPPPPWPDGLIKS
jgi:hypothetical protein